MIEARHHWLYDLFFNKYIHVILKKDFHCIEIDGSWPNDDKSQLVIGNHVSWWDGFWVYYLNKRFLNKKLHVMMLEEQLKSRLFLSRIGGFSINPGHRSVVTSINYTIDKLKEPGNLVVIYPQGMIASFSAGVLPFQKGLVSIVEKVKLGTVLFYVALVDYFSNRKPSLTLYLGSFNSESFTVGSIEDAYRNFYHEAINKQSKLNK